MKKASLMGVVSKSILGLIFVVAIVFAFVANNIYLFPGSFLGIINLIVVTVLMYMTFNSLRKDSGFLLNNLKWFLNLALIGATTGNAINVITYYTSYVTDDQYLIEMAPVAILLALFITIVIVGIGIIMLPYIRKTVVNSKIMNIVFLLTMFTTIALGISSIVGFILTMFGINWLWDMYINSIYGTGPMAIGIALLFIGTACYSYAINLIAVNNMVDNEEEYLEYYMSSILLMSIINIFIEIFRLVLKFFVNKDE